MVRPISYLLAFCLVSAITASSVKAGSRDGTDNFSSQLAANSSQTAIGFAALAVNDVTGTIKTKTKKVKVSDQVFLNEVIETNPASTTQILFIDETVLTIGPDSRLTLDTMVYDPDSNKGKVVVTAARGLFTFVTGSLSSESYEINTPTATIGVRGTKFDLFVSRKGASTVVLRSGAIDVKNVTSGKTRRVANVGTATSVVTKKSEPTPPAPPSPELDVILKPLANPIELQGKKPGEVDVVREGVEEKSDKKREKALKKEEKKEKAIAARKKKKERKAAKLKKQKDKKAAARKKKNEKKAAKRKKQ